MANNYFQFQYQQHTEPVSTQPETVTEDRWHQPLSDPVRRKGIVVALVASGFIGPVAPPPEIVTVDKYYKAFADPVWQKKIAAAANPYFFFTPQPDPPDDLAAAWIRGFTDPVRLKPTPSVGAYPSFFFTPQPDPPDDLAAAWIARFAELPLAKKTHASQQAALFFVAPSGEVITTDKWFAQFTDPTRAKIYPKPDQVIGYPPIVSFSWFTDLSVPSRRVPTATRYEQPSWSLFPDFANNLGWFSNLSDPVRRTPVATRYEQPWSINTSEVITVDKWFTNLSEPVRRVTITRYEQPSWALFPDFANNMGWFTNLSDPVRRIPIATRYEQPWSINTSEVITVDKWFTSLADPVRAKTSPRPDQVIGYPPIVSFGWFGELRDPVRLPVGLKAPQQAYSFDQPFPITVAGYGWFNNLSDPIRRPTATTRSEQQSWSLFAAPAVVTTGWFNNLSDPVFTPKDLKATRVRYQFVAAAARMSWFTALSEPTRPIGLKAAHQPSFSFFPLPITVTIGWFNNLSDPVRVPRPITRYEQPSWSLFVEPVKYVPSVFVDPVRVRTSVARSEQFLPLTQIAPSFGWFANLSEPVRIKPRTRWLDEQSFQHPFVSFSWYAPWREPTPPKRRAAFFTPFTFAPTPPIIPSFGWYGSLSLPRWNKPKVWEGQYQAWNPATINFSYLATMAAYESRDFFLGVLYAFNPPIRAYVDIIDKDPRHRGNLGIIENIPEPGIISSIVTPQHVSATGTPVIAAVRARVAIIVS